MQTYIYEVKSAKEIPLEQLYQEPLLLINNYELETGIANLICFLQESACF